MLDTDTPPMPAEPPPALVERLQRERPDDQAADDFDGLRDEAMREAAFRVGVQTGAKWRYGELNDAMRAHARALDRIFNFSQLLIEGRVRPPVIVRAGGSYRIDTDELAQSTTIEYRIADDAALVARAPSWRQYLIEDLEVVEPNPALYPTDDAERKRWRAGVLRGWRRGIEQANRLFRQNLARLRRDFVGALRYHLLARQKMIRPPEIARAEDPHEADADAVRIDHTLYRITAPAQWRPVDEWRPRIGRAR